MAGKTTTLKRDLIAQLEQARRKEVALNEDHNQFVVSLCEILRLPWSTGERVLLEHLTRLHKAYGQMSNELTIARRKMNRALDVIRAHERNAGISNDSICLHTRWLGDFENE